jgi:2-methylaconitate cis-trans-isomerase PrpF
MQLMRGVDMWVVTSKRLFFNGKKLPTDPSPGAPVMLDIIGSSNPAVIDGPGGATRRQTS